MIHCQFYPFKDPGETPAGYWLFYYFAGPVPLTFLTFPGMEPGLKGVMRGGAGAFFADYTPGGQGS